VCGAFCGVFTLSGYVGAQECVSDSDCADPLMMCDRGDAGDPAPCIDPESCPEPQPGTCVIDPDRCLTNADCEDGFVCEVVEQPSSGCAPSADGSACEAEPSVTEIRECVGEPLTCQTDADCASGLACVEDQGQSCPVAGGGPSGTSGEQATSCEQSAQRLCTWQPAACSSDADCGPNEECVGFAETCSSAPCAPNQECDDTVVCEPDTSEMLCFPTQRACSSAADCASGEVCFDVSTESDELPEWWDAGLGFEYCFSEGLVLAIQGRAAVVNLDSASEGPETPGRGVSADEAGDEKVANRSGGGDGGCAIAEHPTSRPWSALALLVFGLVGALRRWRRH
jgi:MYXO-CTERM domain-containing protein